MNYEERYKRALKRARIGLHDCNLLPCDDMTKRAAITTIYNLFPELAESEDERIRKGIIRNLQYLMDRSEGFVKEGLQERIAWLEKQDVNKEYVFRPVAGTMIENAIEQALKQGNVVLAFNGFYTPVKGKTSDEILAEYNRWIDTQGIMSRLIQFGRK